MFCLLLVADNKHDGAEERFRDRSTEPRLLAHLLQRATLHECVNDAKGVCPVFESSALIFFFFSNLAWALAQL